MELGDHLTPARLRAMPSWLVNQVAILANRLTDQALAETGARRHHFAMLAALEEFGPSSQAELGRCTAIDRSDVVAALNHLADAGHVARTPDPADGRRNIITLTDGGAAYLAELHTRLAAAQDELLDSWSPSERAQLVGLLSRILGDGAAAGGAGHPA